MRLPNGFGSIYYMGKGRRRPYRVMLTPTWEKADNGEYKQKRATLGYYATRKEAMQALSEYNADPYEINAQKTTFADIYRMWAERGTEGLSASALTAYTAAFKKCQALHDRPIAEIKTEHMQAVIDNMRDMSDSTKQNTVRIFHRVFEYALQRDAVTKDYSQYVSAKSTGKQSEMHTPYSIQEIKTLWDNLGLDVKIRHRGVWHISFPVDTILMMIYTGVRPGELLDIKTENVHLEERYMTGGLKNANSKNRIIPIHDDIFELVKNRYKPENEYLITHIDTRPTVAQYRVLFDQVMDKLKFTHLPHDGRHTFATMGKQSPVEDFYISKIMGHKLSTITERVYTHVTAADLVREVNRIEFIKGCE